MKDTKESREQHEAAERRAQAAREGRDIKPAVKPDTGQVER